MTNLRDALITELNEILIAAEAAPQLGADPQVIIETRQWTYEAEYLVDSGIFDRFTEKIAAAIEADITAAETPARTSGLRRAAWIARHFTGDYWHNDGHLDALMHEEGSQ